MTSKIIHKTLILGVGSIGERHLRCFQATGRTACLFVEINATLRQSIAQKYSAPGYDNLEQALSEKPDTAVIAVPAHLHVAPATRLAGEGIHLLIEKPLGVTLAGVEELQRLAEERKIVTAVGYVMRCHPALIALRQAIHGGRFGRPVQITVVSGQHFPLYRPAYRDIYYANRATGGGAIQDAITHLMNAGEWLVGPIERLVADAEHQLLDGVSVEDTVHVLTRQGPESNRVLGSYTLNQYQAPNETTLIVVCEKGTLRWESQRNQWSWLTVPDQPWHDEPHEPLPRDSLFIEQAHRFLDAVEGKIPPHCSLAEGTQTLRVNRAMLESVERRGWVNLT